VGDVMRALVTGGNGFVGGHVVKALREAGFAVRVLDRTPPKQPIEGVEQFTADLLAAENLADAFAGVEVLVHLAALMRGSLDEMKRITVDGTRRLLDAMAGTDCRRIVHTSSFSVYDWSAIHGRIDEACPVLDESTWADTGAYAITKAMQERLVRDAAARHDWTLTVLRPAVIWGRGMWNDFAVGPKVGPLRLVIGPTTRIRLAYVEHVADAFALAAARTSQPRERVLNVLDDPDPTTWRYAGVVCSHHGGFRVPCWHHAVALKARVGSALFGSRRLPYFLQHRVYQSLHKPVAWSNQPLRDALGWSPRFTFDQALQRANAR
jgi:nucleoside-diphosphate-sugar epimerase